MVVDREQISWLQESVTVSQDFLKANEQLRPKARNFLENHQSQKNLHEKLHLASNLPCDRRSRADLLTSRVCHSQQRRQSIAYSCRCCKISIPSRRDWCCRRNRADVHPQLRSIQRTTTALFFLKRLKYLHFDYAIEQETLNLWKSTNSKSFAICTFIECWSLFNVFSWVDTAQKVEQINKSTSIVN